MPLTVAHRMPRGMDLRGLARSPDRPTPAVMPVKAGKTMANTSMKGSASGICASRSKPWPSEPGSGLPMKSSSRELVSTMTTTHRARTPRSAPRVTISRTSSTVPGSDTMRGSKASPVWAVNQGAKGRKASAKAIM